MDVGTEFERHRGRLFGIAYRMLGSAADAEDLVQDTYLRLLRAGPDQIEDVGAWLTRVTTRLAIDLLRSARARREVYVGPWLPEPLLAGGPDPAERAALDESISLALLAVLERLSPAERAVYVLHEAFDLPFERIAEIVERTPAACRQLASRARRHVQAEAPRFDADAAAQREAVGAFAAACASGDVSHLVGVLDEEVVLRSDGGGVRLAARELILGADRVLRFIAGVMRKEPGATMEPATVNGGTGLLVRLHGEPYGVIGFTIGGGRITEIDFVLNPAKLPFPSD